MASKDTQDPRSRKFQWDYDIPQTPFWSDLDFTVGRNFLSCFNQDEIQNLKLDQYEESDKMTKQHILLDILKARLEQREQGSAPQSLREINYHEWQTILVAITTLLKFLDDDRQYEEETLRYLMNHGKTGGKNMTGVNMLAHFKTRTGEYAEAEALVREVLPFLRSHEMLGIDSPQVFGSTRLLIRALWMQGKRDEAQSLIEQTSVLIEGMGSSIFVKYQDDERKMLQDLVEELKAGEVTKSQ